MCVENITFNAINWFRDKMTLLRVRVHTKQAVVKTVYHVV